MERRAFIKSLGATAATVPAWPGLASAASDHLQTLGQDLATTLGADLWRRVREEFQLDPGLAHFNSGSVGAAPRVVTDAVSHYLNEVEGNPNHNVWGPLGDRMEQVRARAAEFIGADLTEVALTRNTTEGMNSVALGIELAAGDEVLTTNHEHGGGVVCWEYLHKHRGIQVNYLTMPDPVESAEQFLRRLESHITPRTRVVSLMHVDTIAARLHDEHNIIVKVAQGTHAFALDPDLPKEDYKALRFSTHIYNTEAEVDRLASLLADML